MLIINLQFILKLLYCTIISCIFVIIVKLNHANYGIVRVWKKNNYGMVCADGFNENAARVVCKQFGYRYSIEVCCMGLEPEPTDMEFAMSDVNCDGTESGLRGCRNEYTDPNCTTGNYASVFCTNTDPANSISMSQKILLQFLFLVTDLTFLTRNHRTIEIIKLEVVRLVLQYCTCICL